MVSTLRARLTYANVAATLALFVALTSGVAWALEANSVRTQHIVDNAIRSADVRDDTFKDGGLGGVDLAASSVGRSELSAEAFNGEITRSAPELPFGIAANSIQGPEVSENTLGGSDIAEQTLAPLDAHETGYSTCDPGDDVFMGCGRLDFTLGRPMPVLASWTYGFGTDGADPPFGECRIRIDDSFPRTFQLRSEDDEDYHLGGVPFADVFHLSAGAHTIAFQCQEILPGDSDLVVRHLHMSVVELGFD